MVFEVVRYSDSDIEIACWEFVFVEACYLAVDAVWYVESEFFTCQKI